MDLFGFYSSLCWFHFFFPKEVGQRFATQVAGPPSIMLASMVTTKPSRYLLNQGFNKLQFNLISTPFFNFRVLFVTCNQTVPFFTFILVQGAKVVLISCKTFLKYSLHGRLQLSCAAKRHYFNFRYLLNHWHLRNL